MPPLEYADHYNDAVVWLQTDQFNEYGVRKVRPGVPIKVRWEHTFRSVTTTTGEIVFTEATVHVSSPIQVGSLMWEGKISELPTEFTDGNSLYEVVFYESTPSLKNRFVNRVVYLRKYKDTLPVVVP